MTADLTDTWKELLDEQRQRGEVYRAALTEARTLAGNRKLSRQELIYAIDDLITRAVDDAWAKPGDRKAAHR